MSRALTTHDCRSGHHGRLCGMTPCDCVCHANERPTAPVAEAGDELRDVLAEWLWESQPNPMPWSEISNLSRDAYLARAADLLAVPALRRLVAEAAEAARLRAVVERVEALYEQLLTIAHDSESLTAVVYRQNADRLRRALDGD